MADEIMRHLLKRKAVGRAIGCGAKRAGVIRSLGKPRQKVGAG